MPAEFENCVRSEMENGGKSKDDAQRICAISFIKRHGMSPNKAKERGMAEVDLWTMPLKDLLMAIFSHNSGEETP